MAKKFAKKIGKIFSVFKSKGEKKPPIPKLPLRRKMVIVGDGECGKTCLVTRMSTGEFMDVGYLPTVFETDVISVNTGKEDVDLTIFDTAGQEDYDRLRPFSYIDVDVAIVCFNLADTDTLTNVTEKWAPEVRYFCGNIPIILVGNKKDLRDPQVSLPVTCTLCNSNNMIILTNPTNMNNDGHEKGENSNVDNELSESGQCDNRSHLSGKAEDEDTAANPLINNPFPVLNPRIPFHVQAPVKHSEGAIIANRIGAIAYFETSALSGDNVEELLLATTKASVLGSKKSKTFKPFLGTLKSWKSVNGLENLSKRMIV